MRHLITTALLFVAICAKAQFEGVIVNEISKDYVELLVVGKKTCDDSTVNLRGWILDDNNGWFGSDATGTHGNVGHLRLSFNSLHWGAVPYGSIILVYNEKNRHPAIPPDDFIDSNHDYLYVLPGTVHLDEDNAVPAAGTTSFASYKSFYISGAQSSWDRMILDDKSDAFVIVDPSAPDRPHFAVAWGGLSNGLRATLGKAGGIFKPAVSMAAGNIFLNNSKYADAANFLSGNSPTPGYPNTPENEAWIEAMRGGAKPFLNIHDPGVCAPGTINLTSPSITANSSIGITLSYWQDVNATIPLSNPAAVGAGIYYIQAENAIGCKTIKPVTAYIVNKPPAPELSVHDFCNNTSTLKAEWVVNNATIEWSNGFAGNEITVTQPGNYTAVQNLYGCKSEPKTVVANPKSTPTMFINAPAVFCGATGSINISAQGGVPPYKYSIDGKTFGSNPAFSSVPAGTYSVMVIDKEGCTAVSSVNLISNTFSGSASSQVVPCGQTGSITVSATSQFPPLVYSINGAPFVASNVFTNLNAGTYSITIRDNTGCTTVVSASVTTFNPIVATAIASPIPCGKTGSITVNVSNGNAPYQYSINGAPFSFVNTFTGLTEGAYNIVVKDALGCTGSAYLNLVQLKSTVTSNVKAVVEPCIGSAALHMSASGGLPPYTFSIDNGSFKSSILEENITPGNHIVYAKDASGCLSSPSSALVYIPPIFSANMNINAGSVRWGDMVTTTVTGNNSFTTVSWLPREMFSNQSATSQTFKADTSVVVIAVCKSIDGCIDTVRAKINVTPLTDVFIPSAFTPNGDGKNDIFRVIAHAVKSAEFRVYNRWGQLVFNTNDIYKGWDGNVGKAAQPSDVYVYTLRMEKADGTIVNRKGTVTLIR